MKHAAFDPTIVGSNPAEIARKIPLLQASSLIYGDGSDGACAFDGVATVLGLVPSVNVYTATRDIYLADGSSVATGVTLNMAGFRIYCLGTLTNNGTVSNNGNAGGVGSAGTGGTAGAVTNAAATTGVGTAAGAGGSGNAAGSNGVNSTIGFPGGAGVGGAGGAGNANAGGTAGTWAALAAVKGGARSLFSLLTGQIFGTGTSGTASVTSVFGGGSGGGGGGGDNADAGGGGGGGGAGVLIAAIFDLANNGVISANGGAGGNGFSTSHNAGGGGGGGGGTVVLITLPLDLGSGTVTRPPAALAGRRSGRAASLARQAPRARSSRCPAEVDMTLAMLLGADLDGMGVDMISAAKRKSLPSSKFALPERNAYPIDTAARVRNAAARLEQARKAGTVSSAEYAKARKRIAAAQRRASASRAKYNMDLGPSDVHVPSATLAGASRSRSTSAPTSPTAARSTSATCASSMAKAGSWRSKALDDRRLRHARQGRRARLEPDREARLLQSATARGRSS